MSSLSSPSVLLTVRGTLNSPEPDAARELHNQTAGSDEGVAAARALGDLSHNVFTPVPGMPGAESNELLFLDIWKSAEGIATFFSDEQVQLGAQALFSSRDATIWMPAEGSFAFELPSPMHLTSRLLGVVRGPVDDPQKSIDVFRDTLEPTLSEARAAGQLSHQLYIKVPMPDDDGPAEALGLDLWADPEGMGAYYESLTGFEHAFSSEPRTSVWQQATGGTWREW